MEKEAAAEAVDTREDEDPSHVPGVPAWDVPVVKIPFDVIYNAPFPHKRLREIPRDGDTEDLLNGLIAECHFLMRDVALPTAVQVRDATTRMQFLNTAMSLAETGAKVGRTVAKLRGAGAVTELRQRHIVEQVMATPAPQTEKGAKT